ncbi:MAG: hypothetical protein ACE5EE_01895 [Fidelibacterota bacterium]
MMSKFWDDLKKNLRVWGNTAAEKAEEFGKVAASKTEEMTKIGRVKLQMHQLQRDLDDIFQAMGEFVFVATDDENISTFTGNEKYYSFIEKAKNLKLQIAEKQAEIERIKQEFEETTTPKPEQEEPVEVQNSKESVE